MILTYKYRLKDNHVKPTLRRLTWAVNQVWNFAVESQRKVQAIYKQGVMFRRMLRYKASRHGANFLEVNEAFTTQTCSCCGDCASDGRPKGIAGLGIREWRCSSCGVSHDRDVNSARNILALGRSVAPPVEGSRRAA
jgi:transposase